MIFVISNSDGDTSISMISEDDFLESLNDGDYGDKVKFITTEQLRQESDPAYWSGDSILVIRGEVVIPKVTRVVEKYEL